MTPVYQKSPSIDNVESVGFNSTQGHFAVVNGERVSISRKDYFQILAAVDRQEEMAERADDYLMGMSEETIADFVEYHANRGQWAG